MDGRCRVEAAYASCRSPGRRFVDPASHPVVVIGGLVSSTLLTPVLYTMVESRRARRQARKRGHVLEPEQHVTDPVPVA